MNNDKITRENIFEIFTLFLRVNKKFSEFEKNSIDIGSGEKLYPSEIHVIMAIGNKQGINVTEISKKFGITKGAVSQVVNKLYSKDFVYKERNQDYGKEILLFLTDKGHLAFEIQDKVHRDMEHEFIRYLESFSPEQVDSFIKILSRIEVYIDTFLND